MTDVFLVQYTDYEGVGFGRDENGPPVPDAYRMVTEQLLKREVRQPGEAVRKTAPHPIWRLWHQMVGRHGGHWLFTVQGRGDHFGPAGTCRFAFVPDGVRPVEAWRAAVQKAAPEQNELDVPDETWLKDWAFQVLAAVVMKRGPVPLNGPPASAAHLIGRVLGVLPDADVASWTWSTCVLERLSRSDHRVSGRWPDEFRTLDPVRAGQVDEILAGRPVTRRELEQSLSDARRIRIFTKLCEQVASGAPDSQVPRAAPSLMDALDRLANRELRPAPRPQLMRELPSGPRPLPPIPVLPDGQRGIGGKPNRVATHHWARTKPTEALAFLKATPDALYANVVLDGLIHVQQESDRNVLDLPTAEAPAPTEWHMRLAHLMRQHVPDRAAKVRGFAGPDRLWSSTADLLAARRWLDVLDIQPADAPALFPDPLQALVEEANEQPTRFITRLKTADDPGQLLVDVAPRMGRHTPETTAKFLAVAGQGGTQYRDRQHWRQIQLAAEALTKRLAGQDSDPARWLGKMLTALEPDRAPDRDFLRAVLVGGVQGLFALGANEPLRDSLLSEMSQKIGPGRGAPKEIRDELKRDKRTREVATDGLGSWPTNRPSTSGYQASAARNRQSPQTVQPQRLLSRRGQLVTISTVVVAAAALMLGFLMSQSNPSRGPATEPTASAATGEPTAGSPGPSPAAGATPLVPGMGPAPITTRFVEVRLPPPDLPSDVAQDLLRRAQGRQITGVVIIGFDAAPDGRDGEARRTDQLRQLLEGNPVLGPLPTRSYDALATNEHPVGSILVILVTVGP